jgi:ribosomal protein S18 acetylase RimI-like enzyme
MKRKVYALDHDRLDEMGVDELDLTVPLTYYPESPDPSGSRPQLNAHVNRLIPLFRRCFAPIGDTGSEQVLQIWNMRHKITGVLEVQHKDEPIAAALLRTRPFDFLVKELPRSTHVKRHEMDELAWICVDPVYRDLGLGKRLVYSAAVFCSRMNPTANLWQHAPPYIVLTEESIAKWYEELGCSEVEDVTAP